MSDDSNQQKPGPNAALEASLHETRKELGRVGRRLGRARKARKEQALNVARCIARCESHRSSADQKTDAALARAEKAEALAKSMHSTSVAEHAAIQRLNRERDAALARAEEAERERDEQMAVAKELRSAIRAAEDAVESPASWIAVRRAVGDGAHYAELPQRFVVDVPIRISHESPMAPDRITAWLDLNDA